MKPKKARTQIICTIGPASRSRQKIEALVKAGMDIARLHCSYARQTEHAENIRLIREASCKLRRKIRIMLDLSGTKVRLGKFSKKSVELKKGARFTLTSRQIKGTAASASVSVPELIPVIAKGDTVLLADGALRLSVVRATPEETHCRVIVGGPLKANQAVHVIGKSAPVQVPTAKDLDDVRFGIEQGVDFIAQSYATSAAELDRLRAFIHGQDARTKIIAKIERKAALKNLEAMIRATDWVMVARGDLGLEIPLEEIALAQKKIIRQANALGKPAIVATEMIFSMMENDRPTRAEISDITNAILDGSAAVLLSGETAMGRFPVEAARMTVKVMRATDSFLLNQAQ